MGSLLSSIKLLHTSGKKNYHIDYIDNNIVQKQGMAKFMSIIPKSQVTIPQLDMKRHKYIDEYWAKIPIH